METIRLKFTIRNMISSRNKYGNKKIVSDGVSFDSKLEKYCFDMLKRLKFEFEFQQKIVLVDKFLYNKQAIREIGMIVDFVVKHKEKIIYIDTKGFATAESKMKYKMLKNKIKEESNTVVIWLHSQKEVNSFLINLKEEENVINQQSNITW